MKNCNMISAKKQQKHQLYDQVKLINMNILRVKKYYVSKNSDTNYVYTFSITKIFRKTNKND